MPPIRIELLQRMPIFGAIRQDTVQFLLEQTRSVSMRADEYFFREGEEASCLLVLESGRAAVCKSWQGRELLLRYLGVGDCFGEMALMDFFPRSASVRAVEDCTALELAASNLYRLYERDIEQFALIQMNMGREVCRRLRASDELLFRAKMNDPAQDEEDTVFRAT